MERKKRKQPGRVPVFISRNRFLAGSPLNAEDPQAPQGQTPPQAAQTKVVKLKPTQIRLPACPHGLELTEDEFTSNLVISAHSKKKLTDDEAEAVVLRNSACIRCNPVCEHGEGMNETELAEAVTSGTRFSSMCPACTNSLDYEAWDRLLNRQGFRFGRGMSPAKFVINRDGSTKLVGQQKNIQTGNSNIEQQDANSNVSRDDLPARATGRKGWSSDTYTDEQNETGDRATENAGGGTPLSSVFRENEKLRLREITNADVDPTCREHGKRFCELCFSADEIHEMRAELAEAKTLAKRDAQTEDMQEHEE